MNDVAYALEHSEKPSAASSSTPANVRGPRQSENIDWNTALPIAVGSALIVSGLIKRSAFGWLIAGVGGIVIGSRYVANGTPQRNKVDWSKRAITIGASIDHIYAFFSDPANLVRILPAVESIDPQSNGHWLWHMKSPTGHEIQFETENVNSVPNESIHWKSAIGAAVDHHGKLEFRNAPAERGTEVELRLVWRPRGPVGELLRSFGLLGKTSSWYGSEALRRAKQLIETGELSTASMTNSPRPPATTGVSSGK